MDTLRTEISLRLCATVVLVLTACLVRFDTQSKFIFYMERKSTFKELHALEGLVYGAFGAAGYNLLQLSRCIFISCFHGISSNGTFHRYMAWLCYLLDQDMIDAIAMHGYRIRDIPFFLLRFLPQVVVYITFATNSAAVENSILTITGVKELQWTKWCNKYTRFCFQAGGAMFCCYVACILMALTTFVSAFNLFRLYSPRNFLRLKKP